MGSQRRRPTRVPLLTALHKILLLSWARQHYHWTVDDWKHVTWSDESRFQLYRTDALYEHFHWPPKSPEMNIIVDIRDALLHAVEKRSPSPRTPMDLLTALQDSWCEFPPGYLQTPVESMPRRFASLLRARGGPTRY
ncbi:hypothetical protein AVEN_230712-1 [Araneus ventricosus]|uniref:Tc1-like transposase DDE domain-containing protein n=1 Tax=Araneus ventricosus TaxID=182803 RepID=A0A4Y2A2F5_ARAVE|nr:hypothetical protein AVEN_230712-1 [Araneus ventricosus]